MSYHQLAVGSPYDPTRNRYTQTEQFRVSEHICELVRFWPSPSRDEVAQHQYGEASFALVDESPDLLVLAYKFGSLDWSDTPFQAQRMTSVPPGLPEREVAEGMTLTTLLVDSETGLIRALRLDALSPSFSWALSRCVLLQLATPFDDAAAGRKLSRLYDRYATTEQMVAERADAVSRTVDD